jgi:dolichyl-phosphate-mannose-protein mannosyltransferase
LQQKSFIDTFVEWEIIFAPILFTLAAFGTRLWKIGISNIVTWDEAQ